MSADVVENQAFAGEAEAPVGSPKAKTKAQAITHAEAMRRIGLALALRKDGHPERALDELVQVTLGAPSLAEGHHQLGNVLKSLGRFREAVDSLGKAALLAPNKAVILLNLGVGLLELKAYPEAANCLKVAVKLEPGRPEGHNILGHALSSAGRCTEALASFEAALRLQPHCAAPLNNLGRALSAQGRVEEAISRYREALGVSPSPSIHSNLLYSMNFLDLDPAWVRSEHENWGRLYGGASRVCAALPAIRTLSGRRLRVGYLSPDLVDHSVAYFIAPILANHDRSKVEVFCYSSAKVPDGVTRRLRGLAEHWRDIARLGDDEAAAAIAQDGLDLLVDLSGHTADNRLRVLARRPAPVQATWIGYPNTTGLSCVDYRLTDALSDPPGITDAFYTERLVRLPDTFSCYEPCQDSPSVGPLPASRKGAVTFGCFNNFAKVRPEMVGLWAQVLSEIPGSSLFLKSSGFADRETCALVSRRFQALGVEPDRLRFDGLRRPAAQHLQLYNVVDIALDTYPYNGATTTCEALWMGVPVVTLAGRTHVSRVGASFLAQLGMGSHVASDATEYRETCKRLAADIPHLATLRSELRERMRHSPLCDAPRFVRRLEDAYVTMVETAVR
jgi:predicted O-linked N-acetylglucosamine transferase (SPINDLY family)